MPIDYATLIVSLLKAAADLYKRAQQEGAMTEDQHNAVLEGANVVFDIYENAPPPPPPPGV